MVQWNKLDTIDNFEAFLLNEKVKLSTIRTFFDFNYKEQNFL